MKTHYLISLAIVAACTTTKPQHTDPKPTDTASCPATPVAEVKPKSNELHGVTWEDPYYWLREREKPEVTAYLEAENAYTDAWMKPTEQLQKELYEELLTHIDENEEGAPYARGDGYLYYTRNEEGKNYDIHCRKKGSLDAPEEIILDENELAEGKDYFAVGILQPSPNGKLLAYSTDELGNERYTLKVLDLETGEHLPTEVKDTYYSVAWANDGKTLFYDRVDAANRPYQLYRHTLGAESDALVYEEKDERFFLSVERTRSGDFLLLGLESAVTTEVHYLDADKPEGKFAVIAPRKQNVEYRVDHHSDRFYIVSNEDAVNFRLFEAKLTALERENWTERIAEREKVTLTAVDAFADHLAIWERADGQARLTVRNLKTGADQQVEFPEAAYAAWRSANYVFATPELRFNYSSLVTPRSVFDVDMNTQERTLVKQKNVPKYDPALYETSRIEATASDGTKVPISLVWRKDTRSDKPSPLLLRGYGSYGANYDPYFSVSNLVLLDRGMVLGIAHIRGGAENGRRWYEDGKYLAKKNTFTDFIAVADELVSQGWTTPDHLAISGRSAGGLLMGAVTNMRPDLFAVVVAGVPFVDVLNTMLDPTIPLTVTEWEEWGNPQDKAYFDYIRSYAPYENIEGEAVYPDMLVTAGLNDPRVAYWEPAKWVARMRATTKPGNTLLLKTNMGAGHGGASGRYDYLKEIAFEDAFILWQLGIAKVDGGCESKTK